MIKNQRAVEAHVEALTTEISETLDLGWLKIATVFSPVSADRIICEATCDFEYRQVCFKWSIKEAATATDEELKDTIVHELVHALIAPLWESISLKEQERTYKLNELATENVARAISHLMKSSNAV